MAQTQAPGRRDFDDLLRRVRKLEEVEAARNHLHAYSRTLDAPTPDTAAALFTEDAVLRTRLGTFTGREEIAAFYRDRLQADPSEKRHFLVTPRTTWIEPGLVEIASYFVFTARAQERSVLGWGTYTDLVRVADDCALISDKTISLHVGTDLATGWPADRTAD